MIPYLLLKTLHILSSTLLFGTGLGSAYYAWRAWKSAQVATIATTFRHLVAADWLFTTPTAILLEATPVDELEHTVEAALPTPEQQRLLGIDALEPCLALHRRSWSRGRVVTVVSLTYPASRYALYSRHRTTARGTFTQ